MTVRYRGGGHKRRYRLVDFKRNKFDILSEVKSIEYDPNRSAFIALLEYEDGEKRYIIAQNGLKIGQTISSGEKAVPELATLCGLLKKFLTNTIISCIELNPSGGAVLARSAGAFAQLMAREGKLATIKLPSGGNSNYPNQLYGNDWSRS